MALALKAKVTCNVPTCTTPPMEVEINIPQTGWLVAPGAFSGGWVWDQGATYCRKHAVPEKDDFGNLVRK